jgi:hypothetical protein
MRVGVQFTGTLTAGQTRRWFTYNWSQRLHVIWYVVPTTPVTGAPQIEWDVQVERASVDDITYWINVKNISSNTVNIEARYAILN